MTIAVVAAALAAIAWWPEPPPPALLPDAVGATPRAPAGAVAWRWSLPQEGAVQYLDVVDDTLVVMDLYSSLDRAELVRGRPTQRLRLVDALSGTTKWIHRLIGSEAVVVVGSGGAFTSVVPAALGNPVVVVGLDHANGAPLWRTAVRDVDGIVTDDGRVVVHGDSGCVELDPATGGRVREIGEGRCLPWGTTLAHARDNRWELWRGDELLEPTVSGGQPPVSLTGLVVASTGGEVVATSPDGSTGWTVELDTATEVVRPFPELGVRVDGPETSMILDPDGEVVASVPWWYRGIVTADGLTFLDVPTGVDRRRPDVVRILAPDGRVLATTELQQRDDPAPASASAAVAGLVGPSMFCPNPTVTCRARRWPAVRLTADGVLMEDEGALGLYGLDNLEPAWQVDLHDATVNALAAGRHTVVALVTHPDGHAELRGYS